MTETMRSTSFDAEVRYGALNERVENLSNRVAGLESHMTRGFSGIEEKISGLASSFNDKQRPQWQAYGVVITVVVILGSLVYWPIREQQSALKAEIVDIGANAFTREELDYRAERSAEDRMRMQASIEAIEASVVPRGEHEEKWRGNTAALAAIQNQIDVMRAQAGDTYTLRDAVMDMRERLDRIERDKIASMRSAVTVNER